MERTTKRARNCNEAVFNLAHELKKTTGATNATIAKTLGYDSSAISVWLRHKTYAQYEAYKQKKAEEARYRLLFGLKKKKQNPPISIKPSKAPEPAQGSLLDDINNPKKQPIELRPPVETDRLLKAVVEELKRLTQAVYVLKTSVDTNTNKRRLF